MDKIELIQGDITTFTVDVIVNAANSSLLGGGGVDGAIHLAAGEGLFRECQKLGGCKVGEAKITGAYNLPCSYVIHTVGPVWKGGTHNEQELLKNCYLNSLKLASENKLKTIAFPGISTGVYAYPKDAAAAIAVKTVQEYLEKHEEIKKVIFVAFDIETFKIYTDLLK